MHNLSLYIVPAMLLRSRALQEDGRAHVWWLVRREELQVSVRSSAVLVMSSLGQLLVLVCGEVHSYSSPGQCESNKHSVFHRDQEECSFDLHN